MQSNQRVLCFGKERTLLDTRRWLLDMRFQTIAVLNLAEFESAAASGVFDLVVLCHTLSSDECHIASALARQLWPAVKILGVASIRASYESPDMDAVVANLEGPDIFLKVASEMLGRTLGGMMLTYGDLERKAYGERDSSCRIS